MNLANHSSLLLGLLGFFILVSTGLCLQVLRQRRDARFEKLLLEPRSQKNKLSSELTHEISNPLSVIKSAAHELLQRNKDEIIRQDLAQILIGVERVSRIVDKARNYLYQKEGPENNLIDLKKLINNVLLFYSQLLETYDIELYLKNIDSVYVEGDSGQLEQLLLDLVGSSIDEVEKLSDKWIEISLLEANNHAYVRVKNSGHGLPRELERKMTNRVHYEKATHTTIIVDLPIPHVQHSS